MDGGAKVVSLNGEPIDVDEMDGAVEPQVVEALESLLDRAQQGEIVAIAAIIIEPDGGARTIVADPVDVPIAMAGGVLALGSYFGRLLTGASS